MPIYEYRCTTCQHLEEVFAKMSDPPPAACESCGAQTLERVLFPASVHYKGSGFYSTDYGSKRKSSGSDGTSSSSTSSSSSSSDSAASSSAPSTASSAD